MPTPPMLSTPPMPSFVPHLEILPISQRVLWPDLAGLHALGYVLYGGTAIALRLGHRPSVDFDFFSDRTLDKAVLRAACPALAGANTTVLQDAADTFSVLVPVSPIPPAPLASPIPPVPPASSASGSPSASPTSPASPDPSAATVSEASEAVLLQSGEVKLSFFGRISFGRIGVPELTADGVVQVASLDDLLATKLKVLLQRVEAKDYVDIALLLRYGVVLDRGLSGASLLFGPTFQPSECLKALVYFHGGDLETLPLDLQQTLIAAAAAVGPLPELTLSAQTLAYTSASS